jgi:hypothetical protein
MKSETISERLGKEFDTNKEVNVTILFDVIKSW